LGHFGGRWTAEVTRVRLGVSAIIISVDQPDDVDALADRVERAGGTLTKPPTDGEFFVGRDAYFADPEHNCWEIAYASPDNPVVVAARRAANVAAPNERRPS
jgi:predicted lactoylglutathione lyase